eukprot:m.340502 g.340502  ORF g.340502 m.340502 type:complete len:463 (+) comp19332_c0_seq1:105-1493(+)
MASRTLFSFVSILLIPACISQGTSIQEEDGTVVISAASAHLDRMDGSPKTELITRDHLTEAISNQSDQVFNLAEIVAMQEKIIDNLKKELSITKTALNQTTEELQLVKSSMMDSEKGLGDEISNLANKFTELNKLVTSISSCHSSGDLHNNETGTCVSPIKKCDKNVFNYLQNGEVYIPSRELLPGSVASANCKEPQFIAKDDIVSHCLSNGSWSKPYPDCISCAVAHNEDCTKCSKDLCLECKPPLKPSGTKCVKALSSCKEGNFKTSQFADILPKMGPMKEAGKTVRAFCHVLPDGSIHTTISCEMLAGGVCKETRQLSDDDTCKQHGFLFAPPRTQQHLTDMLLRFPSFFTGKFALPVYSTKGGRNARCCDAGMLWPATNMITCKEKAGWEASDGGDYYLRPHDGKDNVNVAPACNPSGDYFAGCWLEGYNAGFTDRIFYNDASCNAKTKKYLCSTSDY